MDLIRTLSTGQYDIRIGDISSLVQELLKDEDFSQVVCLVDENTRRDCLPLLESHIGTSLNTIEIQSGERHKTIETCQVIWSGMMELKLGREALLINLGGGVIGDMGGFCASTFKRGIRFLQIPTTLLSQVDASVGGKLGVDFQGVKNAVGVFNNPESVLIDPKFLGTLPSREVRSGFAEIIKHALIADEKEWQMLQGLKDMRGMDWRKLIYQSVDIKYQIVTVDPYEHGLRKALNFGHTIGHGIESIHLEKEYPLLHGESIAIGMICESYLSMKKAGLPHRQLKEIESLILGFYNPTELDSRDFKRMLNVMSNDKKNRGREYNFSFIPSIGSVKVNQTANENEIMESLLYYNSLVAKAN